MLEAHESGGSNEYDLYLLGLVAPEPSTKCLG